MENILINLIAILSLSTTFTTILLIQNRKRNKALDKQISYAEESMVQLNDAFTKVKKERHDFLKHVAAIQYMVEKKQTEELYQYTKNLTQNYEKTNLSIKGENGAVVGLLNKYSQRASQTGIQLAFYLDVPISSLPLPNHEIITLIGNVLENSLDASEKWQRNHKEKATIQLCLTKKAGLYILTCENDTLPLPTKVVDNLFEKSGFSTKNTDGLGTLIIKDTVYAHNGYLDFIHKNEKFFLKIKLPAVL
ncbi:sensor histidine kinase [Mangrovibacillus cuniculi]|uniref:GHKL domain-containing protein n=1 Tax=Mangrovibacillus cuniculi TaxID=2593652 RepID=A0A7S8C941_9BACI|nr:GHKL domain-containing protein [Mangrovibacillus cuniculi]QPC45684.1 GHKL domain-containing protein [Mangrovibacillus cuniculi]